MIEENEKPRRARIGVRLGSFLESSVEYVPMQQWRANRTVRLLEAKPSALARVSAFRAGTGFIRGRRAPFHG